MKKIILPILLSLIFVACEKVEPGDVWVYPNIEDNPFADCQTDSQVYKQIVDAVSTDWVKYHIDGQPSKCFSERLEAFKVNSQKVSRAKH